MSSCRPSSCGARQGPFAQSNLPPEVVEVASLAAESSTSLAGGIVASLSMKVAAYVGATCFFSKSALSGLRLQAGFVLASVATCTLPVQVAQAPHSSTFNIFW